MKNYFDRDFLFGAATAAFQIEGAWNEDGKAPSMWDEFTNIPGKIERNENAKIACDHYHLFRDDVHIMKEIGLQSYRFSISWPRIFPGRKVNPNGIRFYHNLIDELEKAGIEPLVTLFHWDLPSELYKEYGGFTSRKIIRDFTNYAEIIFKEFKGRVKYYISFNEPNAYSHVGYLWGKHPPGIKDLKVANQVTHHQLICHGQVWRMLKEIDSDASISIAPHIPCFQPAMHNFKDFDAAELNREFHTRWFTDPVFLGKYPDKLSSILKRRGFFPEVQNGDFDIIKGAADFFCINHYTSFFIRHKPGNGYLDSEELNLPGERTAMEWPITPYAFYEVLKRFRSWYGDIPIFITENGIGLHDTLTPDGKVHDEKRIDFIRQYLKALLKAKEEGVDVRRYYIWSLMDNFEWIHGYRPRFGMVYVDFNSQKRYLKDSALFYRDIIKSRGKVLLGELSSP
jgi:beta-glucosidase